MDPNGHWSKTLTRLILEKLAELGEATVGSFFPAQYPEARLWRQLLGLDRHYHFKRRTFSTLLSRLQSEGLVARSGARKKSRWRLTRRGTEYLQPRAPKAEDDGVQRIVVFDVPERERKKRDALRLELVAAGFTQLQKSVWCGRRPLPRDFAELVDALRLRPHVHIFSVRSAGTLQSDA